MESYEFFKSFEMQVFKKFYKNVWHHTVPTLNNKNVMMNFFLGNEIKTILNLSFLLITYQYILLTKRET